MAVKPRSKLIVGNWKMNLTEAQGVKLAKTLDSAVGSMKLHHTQVAVAPSYVSLSAVEKTLKKSVIKISAQNMYFEEKGAFTGEVSPSMVGEFAEYVILGHSERRHILGEKDKDIRKKIAKAVAHKLVPILAVGETHIEREDGLATVVVSAQLETGLADLTAPEVSAIVIAYEPVWAIGTGVACEPTEAERMTAHIRKVVKAAYGEEVSKKLLILYGGSVNAKNIGGYLSLKGVDGALVGGASLELTEFVKIIAIAEKAGKK